MTKLAERRLTMEWDEDVDGPAPRAPRINRFYPAPRGIRALFRERARWALVAPNRADRRANTKGS